MTVIRSCVEELLFKAEGEEEGEDLEGRRLILWVGEVGWVGVEVGFLTLLMTTILSFMTL